MLNVREILEIPLNFIQPIDCVVLCCLNASQAKKIDFTWTLVFLFDIDKCHF